MKVIDKLKAYFSNKVERSNEENLFFIIHDLTCDYKKCIKQINKVKNEYR